MKNLEEQLRASREREIPGLEPPADGWEQISAALGSAPGGAVEKTAAGIPGVPGRVSFLLVGATTLLVALLTITIVRGVAAERPTVSLSAFPLVAPSQEQNNYGASERVPVLVDTAQQIRAVAPALVTEPHKREKEDGKSPEVTPPTVAVEPSSAPVKASPIPVISRVEDRAVASIPGMPLTSVTTTSTLVGFPQPTPAVSLPKDFRRRPRPAAKWQVHGAANGFIGPAYYINGENSIYRRSADPASRRLFILPDGEVVRGEFARSNPERHSRSNYLLRAGINRQTSWGGLYRASLGYYRGTSVQRGDLMSQLQPGEILTEYSSGETVVPFELGFQFTFRKRRRLQSYLGVNFITYLYYDGKEESTFFDLDTGQRGLIRAFNSREYFPMYPEISITAGVQYQLSDRWTVGINAWGNAAGNILLEAPLGVEVRYSLE